MLSHGEVTAWRGLASYTDPVTGCRRRRSVSRRTRDEAERALRTLMRQLPGKPAPARPRTARTAALPSAADPDSLHALAERWLAYKCREVRPSTYRDYVYGLSLILPLVGHLNPQALTPLDIEKAVAALSEQHTPNVAGRVLRLLGMLLRQGVRWQLLSSNAAQAVRPPRVIKRRLQVWTPQEARRFLRTAHSHRLYPLFVLALSTGMRKSELLALQWQDLNLGKRELTVQRTLARNAAGQYEAGRPKTDAGHRRVMLAQDVTQTMRTHWLSEHRGRVAPRPADFVFTASSGLHVQHRHLDHVFKRLTAAAGVPEIRFHDLRHTAASLLIRQGVAAKVVADRLGHADVRFTLQVYTHVYDDQRSAAALPMARLLGEMQKSPDLDRLTRTTAGLAALKALHRALGEVLAAARPIEEVTFSAEQRGSHVRRETGCAETCGPLE